MDLASGGETLKVSNGDFSALEAGGQLLNLADGGWCIKLFHGFEDLGVPVGMGVLGATVDWYYLEELLLIEADTEGWLVIEWFVTPESGLNCHESVIGIG